MASQRIKGQLEELQEKVVAFLTEEKDEHKDMNARITSEETLKALQLWRLLEERGIDEAGNMADTLERLSVSIRGLGRQEVVDAIKNVPSVGSPGTISGLTMEEEPEE